MADFDNIRSKQNTKEYEENYDKIFRKKQCEDKCPCTNADKDVKEENDNSPD